MGQTFTTSQDTIHLVVVADKLQARNELEKAEQIDRYRKQSSNQPTNALARRTLAYDVNRLGYHEWKRMEVLADQVNQGHSGQIPLRLRRELGEVQLIALMPTAEGGMPHTRPMNVICYPNVATITHGVTLVHELWHIHQRLHAAWWTEVFREWGWTPLSMDDVHRQIPEKLRAHVRMNPDTIDQPWWVYRGRWVPLPVFANIAKPSMTETECWFYDLRDGLHVRSVPSEIQAEFPGVSGSALEHPRELAAYLLSDPMRYRHAGVPGWNRLVDLVGQTSIVDGGSS